MLSGSDKKKSIHPLKVKEKKRISHFLKVLKSFDENRSIKKSNSKHSKAQHEHSSIKNHYFISIPIQKHNYQSTPAAAQRNPQMTKNNDNISTISKSSKFSSQKVSLPSISLDVYFPEKRYQSNQNHSSIRLKTESISKSSSKFPKIFLNKIEGARTGNVLQFLKLKPTEKYFSKRQNVRLAQKLLLAQPSKDIRRHGHKKFYNEQKSYRSISQSSLKLVHDSHLDKKRRKWHKHNKSQWID